MILPQNVIVMAVDGGRMVLMRNEGDATDPHLAVIEHRECPPPPNRDVFADAAGREFSSSAFFRNSYDNGDPHAAHERAFVASALAVLADHVDDDVPGVIVASDPVSLGQLRAHYPAKVASKLLAEFDKDLTRMPVDAICSLLRKW
ncbi:MAG: host attachment protein [Porphyrobacter sp.]|nr:host attachment protein [Porphyrobacter sp.]